MRVRYPLAMPWRKAREKVAIVASLTPSLTSPSAVSATFSAVSAGFDAEVLTRGANEPSQARAADGSLVPSSTRSRR